jgi:hypothetical protein
MLPLLHMKRGKKGQNNGLHDVKVDGTKTQNVVA